MKNSDLSLFAPALLTGVIVMRGHSMISIIMITIHNAEHLTLGVVTVVALRLSRASNPPAWDGKY